MVYIWYFPHTLRGCLSRDGLYMILSPHIVGLFIQGWSIYDTFPTHCGVVYPGMVYIYFPHTLQGCLSRDGLYNYDTFPTLCGVVYPGMVYIWYFPHASQCCLSKRSTFLFMFFASALSSWGYSHVGSLVINGSWCSWHFPHTSQYCSWHWSYRLHAGHKTAALMVMLSQTFSCWYLLNRRSNQLKNCCEYFLYVLFHSYHYQYSLWCFFGLVPL